MPKFLAVKASDLAGPTNPTGIWSPSFLMLKKALESADDPANVKQALYNWLGERKTSPAQVDALLDLKPDEALAALVQKIGGGLRHEPGNPTLPTVMLDTLRRTLNYIAQTHVEKQAAELAQQQQRLDRIKSAFVEGRSPTMIVQALLK
jgi:hypothetical protein